MIFEVGDIVRISKKFTILKGQKRYPSDTNGEIIRIEDNAVPFKIRFDGVEYNGEFSHLKATEIKLVRRAQ